MVVDLSFISTWIILDIWGRATVGYLLADKPLIKTKGDTTWKWRCLIFWLKVSPADENLKADVMHSPGKRVLLEVYTDLKTTEIFVFQVKMATGNFGDFLHSPIQ